MLTKNNFLSTSVAIGSMVAATTIVIAFLLQKRNEVRCNSDHLLDMCENTLLKLSPADCAA